jgi:hypothetical protein
MKYAMLVYATPGSHDLPEAEFAQVMSEYEALRSEPGYVASAQLHPPEMATTLRSRGGETLTTDGPFADTKEVFGGYYLFDVGDLDTALSIAGRIPALRLGDAVEVRPVVE